MAVASASIVGHSMRRLVNVAFFIGEKGEIGRIDAYVWTSLSLSFDFVHLLSEKVYMVYCDMILRNLRR
jgi:hypothetical protein